MPSLDRKLVARDQFSFSCTSLSRKETNEEFGLSFREWSDSVRNHSSSFQQLSLRDLVDTARESPSFRRKRSSGSLNGGLKDSRPSSSSGSSSSDSGSSSITRTTKLGSGSKVWPKSLMKDGRKTMDDKSVKMQQHGELSRNCSRYGEELTEHFREKYLQ